MFALRKEMHNYTTKQPQNAQWQWLSNRLFFFQFQIKKTQMQFALNVQQGFSQALTQSNHFRAMEH